MKTKNKIALAAMVIAVFLVVVCLISINNLKSAQKGEDNALPSVTSTGLAAQSPQNGKTATGGASKSTVPNDTSNIYKNKDYNFSITFSNTWRGYEVVKSAIIPQGAEAQYDVLLATNDKNYKEAKAGKAVVMSIYVYKDANWELNKKSAHSTEITRGGGDVYTYSIWEETPADLRSITEKEIINVIKTFKYLGN